MKKWDHILPVLVVSAREELHVLKAVVAAQCVPLVRQDIRRMLFVIRHQMPFAIIIESAHLGEDILEVVLNIRDVDKGVPLIIYGEPSPELKNYINDARDRHTLEVKKLRDIANALKAMRKENNEWAYSKISAKKRHVK